MSLLRSNRAWAAVLLMAASVGMVAWQQGVLPESRGQVASSADEWKLAKASEPDARKATEYLATTPMWGAVEVIKPANEIKVEPRWRIMGAMAAGKEKFVMIAIEKQPNQQFSIGDVLPGGAKILDIKEDQICLLIDGKKRALSLFNQGATAL
jgi:hypothetical protein